MTRHTLYTVELARAGAWKCVDEYRSVSDYFCIGWKQARTDGDTSDKRSNALSAQRNLTSEARAVSHVSSHESSDM